jgi:hypothetical protein
MADEADSNSELLFKQRLPVTMLEPDGGADDWQWHIPLLGRRLLLEFGLPVYGLENRSARRRRVTERRRICVCEFLKVIWGSSGPLLLAPFGRPHQHTQYIGLF